MQNNIYAFTVPMFGKSLQGLSQILAKAAGPQEAALLEERLAPDMFPLIRQVQIACDHTKGAAARLAGVEVPKHPDEEKTIAELQARIEKVIAFVESIPESAFDDAAERQITLSVPSFAGKYLTGLDYARGYALPNFFFHYTTAYDILRHKGIGLGNPTTSTASRSSCCKSDCCADV